MSSSIRVPMRTRSSSTLSSPSPNIVGSKTFPRSTAPPTHTPSKTSSPPSTISLSAASGSLYQSQAQIQAQPLSQSQGQEQQGQIEHVASNKPKSRRPSIPAFPAPPAQPSQKPSLGSHLQPNKDIMGLRSPRSLPRMNGADKNDPSMSSSHIARPASSLSSPRTYSSPSPRLGSSASRFGDSHQRSASALSHPNNTASTSNSTTPSLIAKPVSRTQKSTTKKPPSIVTKPNSPGGSTITSGTSMSNTINSSSSSSSSAGVSARSFSLPPIAPSPNVASVQRPFSPTSTTTTSTSSFSILSPLIGSNIPTLTSLTAAAATVAAAAAASGSSSTTTRSKNRLHAGIDSACFMTRSSSGESLTSSSESSSPTTTPVIAATPIMASTAVATGIGTATISSTATLLPAPVANSSRKPKSRRPSTADISPSTSPSARTTMPASPPPPKSALKKPSATKPTLSLSNTGSTTHQTSGTTTTVVKCNCPPPLEFPENVKLEMKREEEEHRKRECGLYEKIIELQIENANLQGEKETLNRVLTRRDKMLLELQMQLKAMEFVCRENEIKVDIDMCPDEAIENWSFKESDEVYQRILITTQDLLRTGSKSLEENMIVPRSSSQHQRHTRTSSYANSSTSSASRSSLGGGYTTNCPLFENGVALRKNAVAGLSESTQPLTVQDQDVDPLLFKETSRPGTLKLDLQTLLRSEQEFSIKSKGTLNESNLAEVDAKIERGGRTAIDGGDDRAGFFRGIAVQQQQQYSSSSSSQGGRGDIDSASDDNVDDDEDDDEGQESEFEELGEDMIKYVELQSSVAPRRESRASSFSMLMPPGSLSAVTTPDLSSAVLMKNMWTANGSVRRSVNNTPLHHPAFQQQHFPQSYHQQQQHHHQYSRSRRNSVNRSSGGSSLSGSSLLDDYFARPQFSAPQEQPIVGLGLGLTGLGRSPELGSMDKFLSAPPRDAPPPPQPLPPLPMALPMPHSMSPRSHPLSCSPLGHDCPSTFPSAPPSHYQLHHHLNSNSSNNNVIRPPPMMPLPPLPACPRYSYRDHTKSKLLQSMRPIHGRTCSHGFAIENVGQFLKRRTYGKTLTRETMHRGLRRRDSV